MNRFVKVFVLGMFVFVGLPMIVIGGLFAWNMIGGVDERRFLSPSGERVLEVRYDCRFGDCITFAALEYERNGRQAKMYCLPFAKGSDRFVLDGRPKLEWVDSETRIVWQEEKAPEAGGQPMSGAFDLAEKCHHQDQFVEKGWPVSFKFRENCLRSPCRREMLLWYAGSDYLFVPCKVSDPSPGWVFSTGIDGRPNMQVEYDHEAQRATWKSLSTGRSGTVDFKSDCDRSRQWREPSPA